jgi:dethiobiotin synthetase
MEQTVFISAIDTDAGKSIITGLMAKYLKNQGYNTITQKFIQTGCLEVSEDIETHRKIMGEDLNSFDIDRTTCPYIFTYPASPHLAAEIDSAVIDTNVITSATSVLEKNFDRVLLEGAGGLFVPITRSYLTIDYIEENNLPLILVTSSKLGSINHTLMSLEIIKNRGINLKGVVYNSFPNDSKEIFEDSVKVIEEYMNTNFTECKIVTVPIINGNEYPIIDFSEIL